MAIKSKKGRLSSRDKNKFRIRKKVSGSAERPRLSVFRSGKHTYAQLISDDTGVTIAAASTREQSVVEGMTDAVQVFEKVDAEGKKLLPVNSARTTKSVAAALAVGAAIGKRAIEKNVSQVVFDRNGFVYHGRIRAVAEGARSAGLKF